MRFVQVQWLVLVVSLFSLTKLIFPALGAGTPGLDLSSYDLELAYEADFFRPLRMIREDDLMAGDDRVAMPSGDVDWVFEGPGSAWTQNGGLHVTNFIPGQSEKQKAGHVVIWNTRKFPGNFLLEFDFYPKNSNKGLAIIFFSATGRAGESIFDLNQPRRGGIFRRYIRGGLDNYHVSYWAVNETPRMTTHLRKNHGFDLVAVGKDNIWGHGPGPHRVRLLKIAGTIQLEVRGEVVLNWADKGEFLRDGHIGLRTMSRTGEVTYSNFKIWKVIPN